MTGHTVLYRGAALADGLSPVLRKPVTIAVDDGLIAGIFDGDRDGEALAGQATALVDGADLVKLYLDGPDAGTAPWSADEGRKVVSAGHARGATVAAHGSGLPNCRLAAGNAVDTLEHGFALDEDIAGVMAANGVTLVPTPSVMHSWLTFGSTTSTEPFAADGGGSAIAQRLEMAEHSVRIAFHAGVAIAAGRDFSGRS